jgi:hypothetical protein
MEKILYCRDCRYLTISPLGNRLCMNRSWNSAKDPVTNKYNPWGVESRIVRGFSLTCPSYTRKWWKFWKHK